MYSIEKLKRNTDALLIMIIILTGILLRFYRFQYIPFTHDEFSALFRTDFINFNDLISLGVKPDGHPAGIQVLLYYWTKWFGTAEYIVKLPFLAFGIASILLAYLTGSRMFGKTTGLITAAYISTLEYTLNYSQIARPYISGMFFGLLMVYFWSAYIQNPKEKRWLHITGFILSAVFCIYNHYFSALLAVFIGFSGLFFLRGKALRNYILSGLVITLLFLPHIRITISQLQMGGLEGWLGKPQNDFILEYFKYLFQFSWITIILIAIIIITGFNKDSFPSEKRKFAIFSLSWFLLSFLTGFVYSKSIAPVLQYSVLIFSFPFLLMGIFSWVNINKPVFKSLAIFIILVINISTLVFQREYYKLFYQSPYYEIFSEIEEFERENPDKLYTAIIQMPEKIRNYQLERSDIKHKNEIIPLDQIKNGLPGFLRSNKTINLLYGSVSGANIENYAILNDYYSSLKKRRNYSGGNFYHFSMDSENSISDTLFYSLNTFEAPYKDWEKPAKEQLSDSIFWSGKTAFHFTENKEFGPVFSKPVNEIIQNENNVVDIKLKVKSGGSFRNALLVVSIESKGEIIDWRSEDFNNYVLDNKQWFTVYHSINMADLIHTIRKNSIMNIYIWNKDGQDFFIDNFEVASRKGNPVYYGLWRNIQ